MLILPLWYTVPNSLQYSTILLIQFISLSKGSQPSPLRYLVCNSYCKFLLIVLFSITGTADREAFVLYIHILILYKYYHCDDENSGDCFICSVGALSECQHTF